MCDGSKAFLIHHFELAHNHELGRKGSQGSHQKIWALSSRLLQGKGYNRPRCMKFYKKKLCKLKTNLQIRGGRSKRGRSERGRRGGGRGRRGGERGMRGGGRGRRGGEDQNHSIAIIDWNFKHLLLSHCGGWGHWAQWINTTKGANLAWFWKNHSLRTHWTWNIFTEQ